MKPVNTGLIVIRYRDHAFLFSAFRQGLDVENLGQLLLQ